MVRETKLCHECGHEFSCNDPGVTLCAVCVVASDPELPKRDGVFYDERSRELLIVASCM